MQTFELDALPMRTGPRPRTSKVPPHAQLDQCSPAQIVDELIVRACSLPFVQQRQSRFASPETVALCIPVEYAHGPAEAYIDSYEFCHIHKPEGMVHATLPDGLRDTVIRLGWAERHTMASAGVIARTIVVIYAPRTADELDVVSHLIRMSHAFACAPVNSREQMQ